MNDEKKYNEALERARKLYEQGTITESLCYVFPELKESEDERIRKSLIDMLKNDEKCYLKEIAWLEKQGEQKPVEPQQDMLSQEQYAKAIDGDITFDYDGDDDKTYGCIAHDSFCLEDFGLKDRDKVKVIVIKDE